MSMEHRGKSTEAIKEDIWIPSVCMMCYNQCAIRVHRVDGIIVKIEGNPDSPQSRGRLCAKGISGIMMLYDPNRVNYPLKRTNPEKGIGIDPKWVRISWDEALDTMTAELRRIRSDDPRKLFFQATTILSPLLSLGLEFGVAFGTPNRWTGGGGLHCGGGAHKLAGMMHASWSIVPDFKHCNYAIYFGASKGHSAGHVANSNTYQVAEAKARGMKLVVVDPMCNYAAAGATEWVPIRPGTDAALALVMLNVLLNELGIYDEEHIKKRTNGPYLIGPDGHYVRDQITGRPLIWNLKENQATAYDASDCHDDAAILGEYEVQGLKCRPAFQLLKDHVRSYTVARAEEISTVPADTIRRIATEFGQAAMVGSTIMIDGEVLPYRPVAAIFFRGSQGHKNSLYNCVAMELLNQVVGASDVPGGCLGFGGKSLGHPETESPRYEPFPGPDGLMQVGWWMHPRPPYPTATAAAPSGLGLKELFPLAATANTPILGSGDQEELWQMFKIPYRPEMLLSHGCNSVMSVGNSGTVAESLKNIGLIVSSSIFLNEFTDFADIVLPDTCYLERYCPVSTWPFIFGQPAGMEEWSWAIEQPVVPPQYERRDFMEVILELAYRIGGDLPARFHAGLNNFLFLKDPFKLEPDGRYSWQEVNDITLKSHFGKDRGLEWFKKYGVIKWPKKVAEAYWGAFNKSRLPIYFENFQTIGEDEKKIAEPAGLKLDYRYYQALPEWLPCVSHEVEDQDYDLYAFYFRDTLHTNSSTQENPWLDEASQMNPYTYFISVNVGTAQKKGIKSGDEIVVESEAGRKVKGKARLTEGIHPEGLGISNCGGHWSPNMPIAKGKGINFDELLELNMKYFSPANLNMDTCAKVKIYKSK